MAITIRSIEHKYVIVATPLYVITAKRNEKVPSPRRGSSHMVTSCSRRRADCRYPDPLHIIAFGRTAFLVVEPTAQVKSPDIIGRHSMLKQTTARAVYQRATELARDVKCRMRASTEPARPASQGNSHRPRTNSSLHVATEHVDRLGRISLDQGCRVPHASKRLLVVATVGDLVWE